MQSTTKYPERILRLPEVRERVGLARSSIYAKIKAGTFPQAIKLGIRSVGWLEGEINIWIEGCISISRNS